MRWDDRIFTGTKAKWSWLVVRKEIRELTPLVTQHHAGQRLCITACDSGPIIPGAEERATGWTLVGDVMVSPPLTPELHIPRGEFDEWYVFRSLPSAIDPAEQYVNYFGFNLADPQALAASQDPTWDRKNYDWLVPLQAKFWADMERLDPSSYVASGDVDVIVTRNLTFAKHMLDVAREIVG